MNYETSTNQFRIHAEPGNPVVLAIYVQIDEMESGNYIAKASDLPLYALIRCGPDPEEIIMEPMAIGESGAMLAPAHQLDNSRSRFIVNAAKGPTESHRRGGPVSRLVS